MAFSAAHLQSQCSEYYFLTRSSAAMRWNRVSDRLSEKNLQVLPTQWHAITSYSNNTSFMSAKWDGRGQNYKQSLRNVRGKEGDTYRDDMILCVLASSPMSDIQCSIQCSKGVHLIPPFSELQYCKIGLKSRRKL